MVRRLKVHGEFGTEGFSLVGILVGVLRFRTNIGIDTNSRNVVIREVVEQSEVCLNSASCITSPNFKVVGLLGLKVRISKDRSAAHAIHEILFLKIRNTEALRPTGS